ncbi:MAG: tetratricopeptide repeat protein [Crocosphaera sp.]
MNAQSYNECGNQQALQGDFRAALESFDQAMSLDPNYFKPYMNSANILLEKDYKQLPQKNRREDPLYRRIKTLYDNAITLNRHHKEAYYNQGNFYLESDEWEKAIESYTKTLQIDPEYLRAVNNRAAAYQKLEDYSNAIKDYDQYLKIKPQDEYILYHRSYCYIKLPQYEKAVENLKAALSIRPNNAIFHKIIGIIYHQLKKISQAKYHLTQALDLNCNISSDIDLSDFDLADLYFCLADIFLEEKKYEKAIQYGELSLKAFPNCRIILGISIEHIYERLARCYLFINEDQKAINYLELISKTNDYAIYNNLALAYFRLNNYKQSLLNVNKVIKLNPDLDILAISYFNRAIIRNNLEDKRAKEDLNKAADIALENNDIDLYKKCLQMIELIEYTKKNKMTLELSLNINIVSSKKEEELELRINNIENKLFNFEKRLEIIERFTEKIINKQITIKSCHELLDELQNKLNTFNYNSEYKLILSDYQKEIKNAVSRSNSDFKIQLVINRKESREYLIKACKEASKRLIFVCPWLGYGISYNNYELLDIWKEFLDQYPQGIIDIGFGKSEQIEGIKKGQENEFNKELFKIKELTQQYPNRFSLYLIGMGTHEKYLVCDEKFVMIGSHNFLTSGPKGKDQELGIITTNKNLIDQVIEKFDQDEKENYKTVKKS